MQILESRQLENRLQPLGIREISGTQISAVIENNRNIGKLFKQPCQ